MRARRPARGGPASIAGELADVQGTVLRGYKHEAVTYLFLEVTQPAAARRWLGGMAGRVQTAAPPKPAGTVATNVGLTWHGLRVLGVDEHGLASFPKAFRAGMRSRARLLGDVGESAPSGWDEPFRDERRLHVVVQVSGPDRDAVDGAAAKVRHELGPSGLAQRGDAQQGNQLVDGREHFGWPDGLSQPGVAGVHDVAVPGEGALDPDGRWRLLQPGEFVLGHVDEDGVLAPAPQPARLGRNGSYLVYRKLRQHVGAFRDMLHAAAGDDPGIEADIAAKLVGRWRDDGAPRTLPSPPEPDSRSAARRLSEFSYADDRNGYECPLGAHIRRANPRDSLPFDGALVNRHRILRRGIPYGDPLPDGPDDGADRGLLFLCYQADIERQFEFVQSEWLLDGNVFGLGTDRDALLGNVFGRGTDRDARLNDVDGGSGRMTLEGAPPRFLDCRHRTVTCRGGAYFFVPSVSGLRYLGGLPGSADSRGRGPA